MTDKTYNAPLNIQLNVSKCNNMFGLSPDKKLNWNEHTDQLKQKLNSVYQKKGRAILVCCMALSEVDVINNMCPEVILKM